MRIICDQCDSQISGRVKRFSGNFNLHPQCFTPFTQAPNRANLPKRISGEAYQVLITRTQAGFATVVSA
jgi:hypothetical protein